MEDRTQIIRKAVKLSVFKEWKPNSFLTFFKQFINTKIQYTLSIHNSESFIEIIFYFKISSEFSSEKMQKCKDLIQKINKNSSFGEFSIKDRQISFIEKIITIDLYPETWLIDILIKSIKYMKKKVEKYIFGFQKEFILSNNPEDIIAGCRNGNFLKPKVEKKFFRYTNEEFDKELEIIETIIEKEELLSIFFSFTNINYLQKFIVFGIDKNYSSLDFLSMTNHRFLKNLTKIVKFLNSINLFPTLALLIPLIKYNKNFDLFLLPTIKLQEFLMVSEKYDLDDSKLKSCYFNLLFEKYNSISEISNFENFSKNNSELFGFDFSVIKVAKNCGFDFMNIYYSHKSIRHPNFLEIYGICKTSDGFLIITEKYDPLSYFSYFTSNLNLNKFYESISEICDLVSYCNKKSVFQLFISYDYISYSNNKVKILPRFSNEIDYKILSPEELDSAEANYDKSELYRIGLLIYKVLLENNKEPAFLNVFTKNSLNILTHKKQIIQDRKTIPISKKAEEDYPHIAFVVRELLKFSPINRLDLLDLSKFMHQFINNS